MLVRQWLPLAVGLGPAWACDGCYGPQSADVVMTRLVRRMQPDALNATTGPRAPLEWGQLNFLHTTDTHGWLEGHVKEENYGADWGDFVAFSRRMKQKAQQYKVDLLLIDTGDLHDGNGLSDATPINGNVSNAIFERLDYDLLTIGNHELYISEIAYETFTNFSKVYGHRYVTSNVEIKDPVTGRFEYIGAKYRYFRTHHGLRIMAFGVLFDFTGNSNVSRITKAANLVKQPWFVDAVQFKAPIDLFLLVGHNPIDPRKSSSSTLGLVQRFIRDKRPGVPIQIFGGHSHIRDFKVYDNMSTGLESGRYCETLGWLSMSGIKSATYKGVMLPPAVPHPTRPAVVGNTTAKGTTPTSSASPSCDTPASLVYGRRYLDWNRRTFAYHAPGSQDSSYGRAVSAEILQDRRLLNLSALYGCAPQTYCQSCQPFGASGNIFSLSATALSAVVVNPSRADRGRLIIINTGSIRFDLVKGPFTYDDSFIVSPFTDAFQYLPDVPYSLASQTIGVLNSQVSLDKRRLKRRDFGFSPLVDLSMDTCRDPPIRHRPLVARAPAAARVLAPGRVIRRQASPLTPGYVTTDDFGTDGDDTSHRAIPAFRQPEYLQANASLPAAAVDLIFLDYVAADVLAALATVGGTYTTLDVLQYLSRTFTTNSYLPAYAKIAWQQNVPNCPVGESVGE
ncbi:MAG: hypothetical protein M1826_000127 [Phylliscum demangeonii]|nr:MAG: hypothetical protein M1826_000127 [Phylliscum demangeonii]